MKIDITERLKRAQQIHQEELNARPMVDAIMSLSTRLAECEQERDYWKAIAEGNKQS